MTDKEAKSLALGILLPVLFGGGKLEDGFKALLSNSAFVIWLVGKLSD